MSKKGKLFSRIEEKLKGRPIPSSTRAGQRPKTGSRYGCGGNVSRKKGV